ncbi:MAG: hypothetical protein JNK79_12240 [Chitinophagaceae bacterium]|nr:hypothetical protein [Chitinophagaceae bacterium]
MTIQGEITVRISHEDAQILRIEMKEVIDYLSKCLAQYCSGSKPTTQFITAIEFMQSVKIGRTKFDELIAKNKIKTIKKKRKIYVLPSEVDRYFTDPSIN